MRLATPLTVTLLFFALLGSLSLNLYLYSTNYRYYTNLQRLFLDPLGLSAYPTSFPTHLATNFKALDPRSPKTVVLLGDSRAYSWPLAFPASVKVINRGINGQTSSQVLGRAQAHLQDLHPQLVVIQVGINDLKMIPLFPDREGNILQTYKTNLVSLVGEIHSLGAIAVVTTLFPLGKVPWQRRLAWSDRVELAVEDVNNFIRRLDSTAETQGPKVWVFDAAQLLQQGASRRIQPQYSQDLLHINSAGYDRLNAALIPLLQEALNLSAPPSDTIL
ncbi:MAG: GDSL-type esterase/lipase family protein [Prochlorothrix sp.]|nr:GDSL-type esterase/lipase family protein [Prochlorothrix sp.]